MQTKQSRWSTALVLLFLVALPTSAGAQAAEVVLEWNRILQTTVGTAGALPQTVFFTRPYAMMHVAIFDALNSIDVLYTPYAIRADAAPNASREAAAAQAAHDVLAAQFPNQQSVFAAALAATLSRLPADAARAGALVGAAAAKAIVEMRAGDGWNRVPPQFLLPALPGYWQPTPPLDAPPAFTHYPDVVPFAIGSAHQFLMEAPPALTSERYAADFNEVKALGAANSATRTPDQTIVARVFGVVGTTLSFSGVWNNVARDLARARGLNGLETARLFALVNMAVHDALLVSFTGKFLYGLWRPITAIRSADRDGNPATDADAGWTSLIGNPPYPTYPGNLACLAASAGRVLHRFFDRDDIAFTVTWPGIAPAADVTRAYNGFRELADEAARSRIYGGIHFTFDTLASFGVCTPLADYTFENHLRLRLSGE